MQKSRFARLVLFLSACLSCAAQAQSIAAPNHEVIPTPVVTDPNGRVIPYDVKKPHAPPESSVLTAKKNKSKSKKAGKRTAGAKKPVAKPKSRKSVKKSAR